jgi:hypothetical protein
LNDRNEWKIAEHYSRIRTDTITCGALKSYLDKYLIFINELSYLRKYSAKFAGNVQYA